MLMRTMTREALTTSDLDSLRKSFITPELAQEAGIFRVDLHEGSALVGRNGRGDYSGIVFPYLWPGENKPREYRVRRDHPDLVQQENGTIKQKAKYLSPPGKGNMLYFPPGVKPEWLQDVSVSIIITEGEKKALALWRLAWHAVEDNCVRFLPVGLAGVWSWKGVVGKTFDELGVRQSVKGVISDFDRITWGGRTVYIVFDSNIVTNESVNAARRELGKELARRKACVRFVELLAREGVNGVDDMLGAEGPDYVLDLIYRGQPLENRPERKSQATKLVEFASEAELFHTRDGDTYASFQVNGHLETWPVKSRGFRDWLTRRLYEVEQKAPAAQNLQDALNLLNSRARFDGKTCDVHIRVAQHEGTIYVDLADNSWRVVKISVEGWQVIAPEDAPVRFRRSRGMLALPEPELGCSINRLHKFVNVTDQQWPLILAALVAYLRPSRPFPLLALHGEQGSAKSTTARILRALIDPNKAALRSEPKDERDLMIAATNGWVVVLDNLSRIPPSLSDALCRLATGGGFGTRKLYENDEEVLFDAMRPVMVNGIEELATRSDLLDRALVLTLPAIPDDHRRTEAELWEEFERERAGIFGAMLDAVSCALRNESIVHLEHPPRMADFAHWVVAAEPALGLQPGEFMMAYVGNREAANDMALEASSVSAGLLGFVEDCEWWEGTASELLSELNSRTSNDEVKKQLGWPKSPQGLGAILKRLAPNLRAVGINVRRGSGRQRRTWTLEKFDGNLSRSSRLSPEDSSSAAGGDNAFIQDPYLSRELSHGRGLQNPPRDEGDEGDKYLRDFSNTQTIDDEFSERAAISEFDGGLTRDEAERLARTYKRDNHKPDSNSSG